MLINTKYFRLWYVPELFGLGIAVDTENLMWNIQLGTLQFVFGDGDGH